MRTTLMQVTRMSQLHCTCFADLKPCLARGYAIFSLPGEGRYGCYDWRSLDAGNAVNCGATCKEYPPRTISATLLCQQIFSAQHRPHGMNLVEINNKDANCTNCINIYFKIFLEVKMPEYKYKMLAQASYAGRTPHA